LQAPDLRCHVKFNFNSHIFSLVFTRGEAVS